MSCQHPEKPRDLNSNKTTSVRHVISNSIQKGKPQIKVKLKTQNPYIYRPHQIEADEKPVKNLIETCLE
jgi:hypothetical protein